MRRAKWTETGIELVDEKPGPLPSGWVRLRVLANGLCGSDLHLFRRTLPALVGNTPGHEIYPAATLTSQKNSGGSGCSSSQIIRIGFSDSWLTLGGPAP